MTTEPEIDRVFWSRGGDIGNPPNFSMASRYLSNKQTGYQIIAPIRMSIWRLPVEIILARPENF
jgi:hypothetical protein